MTKTSLPDDMRIACCLTCTLGSAMRDCKNCPFQIGLLYKGFELIKQAESATIPTVQVDTASNQTLS